jgi:PDZ domain
MSHVMSVDRWARTLIQRYRRGCMLVLAAAIAIGLSASLAFAQQSDSGGVKALFVADDDDQESASKDGQTNSRPRAGEVAQISDRWIGVVCEPVEESLRAHLAVPEGIGMIVTSLVPGAPADRAGIQQYDILLSMDGRELKDVDAIIESVKKADEKGITVVLHRKGEEVTKTVVPEKRPAQTASASPDQEGWVAPNVDTDKILEWVESLKAGKGKDGRLDLRFLGPGMEMQDNIEIPSNISISISRQNDEPARITIKRGDETWEVTEDRLDELPEDLRPFVKRMAGQGGGMPRGFTFEIPDMPAIPKLPEGLDGERWDEMEERIEDMRQKMEKMLEQMQDLRDEPKDGSEDIEDDDA